MIIMSKLHETNATPATPVIDSEELKQAHTKELMELIFASANPTKTMVMAMELMQKVGQLNKDEKAQVIAKAQQLKAQRKGL